MSHAKTLLFSDAERGPKGPLRTGTVACIVAIYLATRLVAWIGAYTGASFEFAIRYRLTPPLDTHEARLRVELSNPESEASRDRERLLEDFAPLCRFDGVHYRTIVEGGYRYKPARPDSPQNEKEQNIAFFPLFPLVARGMAALAGSARSGMMLTSHLASLAAAFAFFLWMRWRVDERSAYFGLALLFCLPQACYYSFGYAESCTLLLTVAICWLLEAGRGWWAAIACGLATATRPTAAGLIPMAALYSWFSRKDEPASRVLPRILAMMVVGAAGIAAYAIFLTIKFGSPLVYFTNFRMGWVTDKARADWLQYLTLARVWDQFKHFGRAFADVPASLVELLNPFAWNMPTNFWILFLCLAGLARVPKSFRPLLLLGPLIFLQSYLASGGATFGVQPMSRYMAVTAPAFVVWGAWAAREWPVGLRCGVLAGLLLLQFVWALRFGLGEWSS